MISQEYLDRIKYCEGFCRTPKRCTAGYLSIGYGRNIETNQLTAEERRFINHPIDAQHPITDREADFLLQNDVEKVARKLDEKYPWWRNMDAERQFVMLDMCYNMGIGSLSKFKKTLEAMRTGDYDTAAEEIRKSKYFRQTGHRGARNYVCLKTGVYDPSVTQRTMDGVVAQYASGKRKTPTTIKATIIEDRGNYDNCMAQISTGGKTASNGKKAVRKKTVKTGKTATKASMKTSADKSQIQMERMITAMNTKNSKDKAIDSKKAAKALYDKYGNEAPKKLKEALMSPVKYAEKVKDPKIKTSRDAVNHLIGTAKAKSR